MLEPALTPRPVIEELTKNGVSHVICIPDSETNYLYEQLQAEESLRLVPVCREGETLAIAAGLWVGGKRPVVLIQNTGLFEAGDSIRGLGVDVNLPVVLIIGYRGWTRHGSTPNSNGRISKSVRWTGRSRRRWFGA